MENRVIITSATIALTTLKQHVETELREPIDLRIKEADDRMRGITPEMLVAIVGAGGTVLGALITAVIQFMSTRGNEKIVFETEDGRIEVSPDTPDEKIEQLLARLRRKPETRIILP